MQKTIKGNLKVKKPGVTKCGKMGLQSVLGWWVAKCGNIGLQSVLVLDCKVWQNGLVSALGITKCGGIIK